MILGGILLSAAAWIVSLWMLWLSAREAEALRSRGERQGDARDQGLDPLHAADLEVRLAAWVQLAVLCLAWVRVGSDLLPVPDPFRSLLLLPLGMIPALVVVRYGRSAGRRRPPAGLSRWVLAPIRGLVMWVAWISGLCRRGRIAAARRASDARESADATPSAAEVREGVEDLLSLTLEEIMVPRSQVVALEGKAAVREAIEMARRFPHTIYPVYGESVDQPLGVVRILDLVQPEALDRPLRELVSPARIVPETMSGFNLLGELCGSTVPAAMVVDEFGGMAGFVTVEDLVEVLVGDLVGEHEVVRTRIQALGGNTFRLDGTCTVEEFNERFGELLPDGEYETVAGLFLDRTGRIPEEGDELKLSGVTLEVTRRTDRRILSLKAELSDAGSGRLP